LYSCCKKELLLELSTKRFFVGRRFVVLRRSLVSATLLLFQVLLFRLLHPIFISSEQQRTHILLLLYHREGRERERKRKVRNSSPLFRRIIAKPVQQNKKEIERLRELHNTEEENCVLYPIRREFLKRKDDPSVLFAVQI
jgi:hypothetical protein